MIAAMQHALQDLLQTFPFFFSLRCNKFNQKAGMEMLNFLIDY